jgi:hypothetical protein
MSDLVAIAVTILFLGAMLGGFSKYYSEEDRDNLWAWIIGIVVGLFLLGLILNDNSSDNTPPLCDISIPGCEDSGPDPDFYEP